MAERLSDKLIRALPSPPTGNKITYDTEVKGFGIRVTAAGARSFVINYTAEGHERRMTIGLFPTWNTTAARDEAKEIRRRIDRGGDPLGQRIEAREAPTVRDLWKQYEVKHLPTKRARSASDDRSMWETYILPRLGPMKVATITHSDVDDLHSEISREKPTRANRVVEVLRKAINLAIRWGWRSDNPCTGVVRNTEQKRERYLTTEEVGRLLSALATHKQRSSCDAILMLLLTGARKSEVLGATWEMFDLNVGVWTKPASLTKQNKVHRVPLSKTVITLLEAIKGAGRDDVFVFPRMRKPGPTSDPRPVLRRLTDVKRTWIAVCALAKVPNARIHDLRHTFASAIVSGQHSISVVGALLGHSNVSTTQRYAHLYDEPLRDAVNSAGSLFRVNLVNNTDTEKGGC